MMSGISLLIFDKVVVVRIGSRQIDGMKKKYMEI